MQNAIKHKYRGMYVIQPSTNETTNGPVHLPPEDSFCVNLPLGVHRSSKRVLYTTFYALSV
jgi:hypothetical protein